MGVFVDLAGDGELSREGGGRDTLVARAVRTLAIRARKNDRMRNLTLSSSVCKITKVKFCFGSREAVLVMSSTISIYCFSPSASRLRPCSRDSSGRSVPAASPCPRPAR